MPDTWHIKQVYARCRTYLQYDFRGFRGFLPDIITPGDHIAVETCFHMRQRSKTQEVRYMYCDKTLICCECSENFCFRAGEQEFFKDKGLVNEPKRCPNCRVMVRVLRSGKDPSTISEVTCDQCNNLVVVPFKPNGSRPVYCNRCRNQKSPDPKHLVQMKA